MAHIGTVTNAPGGSTPTVQKTLTAGNSLLVAVCTYDSTAVVSVVSDLDGAMTLVRNQTGIGGNGTSSIYRIWSAVGGLTTITVTFGSSPTCRLYMSEFDPLLAFDQGAGAAFTNGDPVGYDTGNTSTTSEANELVYAVVSLASTSMVITEGTAESFTLASKDTGAGGGNASLVEYKYVSSAAAYKGTATLNAQTYGSIQVTTFTLDAEPPVDTNSYVAFVV